MKLKTECSEWRQVHSISEIAAVLIRLGWQKNEDTFLILDNWPSGFAQVAKWRPGRYIVEWREAFDCRNPDSGLMRAQRRKSRGRKLKTGNPQTGKFVLYENDLLSIGEALDVLTAFWQEQTRPHQYTWRDMTKEFSQFKRLDEIRKGESALHE